MRTFHDELKDMNGYTVMHNIPVQVVGLTTGGKTFNSLVEARKEFPTLDPFKNTKHFSWAMRDKVDGKDCMRFETWEAYNVLSQ